MNFLGFVLAVSAFVVFCAAVGLLLKGRPGVGVAVMLLAVAVGAGAGVVLAS